MAKFNNYMVLKKLSFLIKLNFGFLMYWEWDKNLDLILKISNVHRIFIFFFK